MLKLYRKEGQQIYIDKGRIKIRICRVGNETIVVGIEAPKEVDIDREELFVKKRAKALLARSWL